MTSENPPRRSKKPEEPQTIDLEAKRIDAQNTDASASPTESKPDADSSAKPAVDAAPADTVSAGPAGPKVEAPKTEKPAPKPAEPAKPVTPQKTTGGSSGGSGSAGALAAGIIGGLIVLAGAGAAQYAGYIPNLGPVDKASQEQVTNQIAALQTKLDAVAQKADNPPTTDLSGVESQIKAINDAMAKLPVGDLTDVLAIQGKLNETAAMSEKVQTELASVANRLKQAEAKINQPRDDVDVARAIASAALKAAIDRGGPFITELATLKSVAKDDSAVAQLQAYAEKGVPSRAELIKSYPDAADTMLAVLNKPIPGQSLSDRLFKSAFSVIKVRPVGDVEGDSPQAVIARIGDKLQNNDFVSAAKEWDTLPDDMKAAAKDFKSGLDARIQVEALVGQTLTNAVTSTGKQG